MKLTLNTQKHGFHLVNPSPWPIISAFAALMLTFGGAMYMHGYAGGFFIFRIGFILLLSMMFLWWRDVLREANYEGQHTKQVQTGIKLGMLLFIVSEIMFFFAFFWGFFHSSFNPSHTLGGVWPPAHLTVLNPWGVPLINTLFLLTSGACITVVHIAMVAGRYLPHFYYYGACNILALLFTYEQMIEYEDAPFTISDGTYGSVFYMATGFHGFHVIIGLIFLLVGMLRVMSRGRLEPFMKARLDFTPKHHVGFECAVWYWHFVDVVWLFLFITIYWWGS